MARLQVSTVSIGHDKPADTPTYWCSENHTADNYLRVENWSRDVQEYMIAAPKAAVPLTLEGGRAILRYREDAKMYAAIRDTTLPPASIESLVDPLFWDDHWRSALVDWPGYPNKSLWLQELLKLRDCLDSAIATHTSRSAFIKLSVRSPKDAVLCLSRHGKLLADYLDASDLAWDDPGALAEDVRFLKDASWNCLRVTSGEEALHLLLRSDRVYVDILQQELFSSRGADASMSSKFDLSIHVHAFCADIDPGWEFRGFVSKGNRTGLTAYNPWFFDESLVQKKAEVLDLIVKVWSAVEPRIQSKDYSLDFVVTPDLSRCAIVEVINEYKKISHPMPVASRFTYPDLLLQVNDFLPPLAGSGLFNYHDPSDRELILNGPFEFRVKDTLTSPADFIVWAPDSNTGEPVQKMIMQPAPPHIMSFMSNSRRAKFGLPPLKNLPSAEKQAEVKNRGPSDQRACCLM